MMKTLLSARRGATAVEFALVAGPLVLCLLGMIEFGRLSWQRQALQNSALAGARCMGLLAANCASGGAYSASAAVSYIQTVGAGLGVTIPSSGVTLNRAASCAGVTGFSSVTVAYTFRTVAPALLGSLSNGVPVTVTACFPNNS